MGKLGRHVVEADSKYILYLFYLRPVPLPVTLYLKNYIHTVIGSFIHFMILLKEMANLKNGEHLPILFVSFFTQEERN